jgi:hypothetical protein
MAEIKYTLIILGALRQFHFNQMVAISLLDSSATPIMIIEKALAAKIETNPATEYQTATAEITNPLISVR